MQHDIVLLVAFTSLLDLPLCVIIDGFPSRKYEVKWDALNPVIKYRFSKIIPFFMEFNLWSVLSLNISQTIICLLIAPLISKSKFFKIQIKGFLPLIHMVFQVEPMKGMCGLVDYTLICPNNLPHGPYDHMQYPLKKNYFYF